jgi:hypothetical protein
MTKWRKALAMPRADWLLLTEAAFGLLRAWVLLRLVSFRKITATLYRPIRCRGLVPADIRKVRWAVETAARNLPIKLTCLPQAFTAAWMLMARGGRPLMHYGVAKSGIDFEAHAWVVQDERPVIGHRAAVGFTLLATFPAQKETGP